MEIPPNRGWRDLSVKPMKNYEETHSLPFSPPEPLLPPGLSETKELAKQHFWGGSLRAHLLK
jgi:hypothetical protein